MYSAWILRSMENLTMKRPICVGIGIAISKNGIALFMILCFLST